MPLGGPPEKMGEGLLQGRSESRFHQMRRPFGSVVTSCMRGVRPEGAKHMA